MSLPIIILMLTFLGAVCLGWLFRYWAAQSRAVMDAHIRQALGAPVPAPSAPVQPPIPEPVVQQHARPPSEDTVRVCLHDGKARFVTIPARAKRFRVIAEGRAWEHKGEHNGLWLYEPIDGAHASPRQAHLHRRPQHG